jgi:predicted dehydrogenase
MINVAIIGAGYMANEHIKAFNDISDVCVLGIYSKTKLKSEKLAAIYNIQNVCDSIDDLYKKTKADIVVVCTSVLSIHDISIECFRYKWVCLIEKPVGYNLEEAKSIFEQSVTSKSRVYVSLNRRNYSSTISVIESLKKNSNNRLVHIYDQQNTINALLAGQPKAVVDNWMFANSIHLVDYFNIFCRGEVVKIDKIIPWEGNSTNFILTKILFDSGDIGIYESIWNAPGPWAVVITTTDIRWELRPLEQAFIQSNESRKLEPIIIKEQDLKFKPGLRQQAQEIVNVVLNKKNNAVLLSSAMKTMQLVDKIYFSN